jgi:hypothetical protein
MRPRAVDGRVWDWVEKVTGNADVRYLREHVDRFGLFEVIVTLKLIREVAVWP